jgi:hypothetical protein
MAQVNMNASIAFQGNIACGGSVSLVLGSDGTYTFHGGFHDSGFVPYNLVFAMVVTTKSGKAFTFSKTGHVDGTANLIGGSASRDFSWTDTGTKSDVAAAWPDFVAGYEYHWKADVNADVASLVQAAIALVPIIKSVVAVV